MDAELIARDICPVCMVPRRGRLNPRRALQEHIRASKDPAHIMWRGAHYNHHFKRGGDMYTRRVDECTIKDAVRRSFGEEWSQRVTIN